MDLNRFTENIHPLGVDMGEVPLDEVLLRMQMDSQEGITLLRDAIPQIEAVVRAYAEAYKQGGRIFYVGAGTSGRLGFVDAAELPATFGIFRDRVQAIFPGDITDTSERIDSSEDDEAAGRRSVIEHGVRPSDLVIGITASGETPFVIGAIDEAKERGARTAGIVNNEGTTLEKLVDLPIVIPTGPELIAGSTRLKAGTVQKVVLNMLSTAAMISLGKVYRGYMVGLRANNEKLRNRAMRALTALSGRDASAVELALSSADYEVDTALVMLTGRLSVPEARELLESKEGDIRAVMEELKTGGSNVSTDT